MENIKKQPERRCTGCGEHYPKSSMIRVLRTPEGEILLDATGKKSGRGAYLCKNPDCFKKARKSRRIEAALCCPIPEEIYDRMEKEISLGIQ